MIRVLSIDWDYYIDISNEKRNTDFPVVPDDLITEKEREALWRPFYEKFDLTSIGILNDDFMKTKEIIQNYRANDKIIKYVHDSHRYIYDVVHKALDTNTEESIIIYNIDHHHDMYQYRAPNEKVNCSNWVAILQEELGDRLQYYWIKRDDSEEFSLAGKVECNKSNFNEISQINFDILYLCKSGAWSPPHLDEKYLELVSMLTK